MVGYAAALGVAVFYGSILFGVWYCKRNDVGVARTVYINLILMYALILLSYAVFDDALVPEKQIDLVPFYRFFTLSGGESWRMPLRIFIQFVLFMPFGFFGNMQCRLKGVGVGRVFAAALCAAIFLEFLQFVIPLRHMVTLDDIIFGTLGSALGSLIFEWRLSSGRMQKLLKDVLYH